MDVYLCWLVPKHMGVQITAPTLPDLGSQSVCSAGDADKLLTLRFTPTVGQTDGQVGDRVEGRTSGWLPTPRTLALPDCRHLICLGCML